MSRIENLKGELKKFANPEKAKILARFFKTGEGEYGEGMKFLGLDTPNSRKIAKSYNDLSLKDLGILLGDEYHDYRFVSLVILVNKFKGASEKEKGDIYRFYIKNSKRMNNWDLVDVSSHHIVGQYLLDKNKEALYKLARSNNLWEKRISIISTYAFIRNNQFEDTLKIAEILLNDCHDLIHKAVGWMLREVG
ncbi:MAG: DNA alkylation repair protein, partial [archaeon]